MCSAGRVMPWPALSMTQLNEALIRIQDGPEQALCLDSYMLPPLVTGPFRSVTWRVVPQSGLF